MRRRHAFDPGNAAGRTIRAGDRELRVGDPSGRRRWRGRVAYWLLFLAAGVGFVLMFEHFTGSRGVAVAAVAFLLGYMLLTAHFAVRSLSGPTDRGGLG